MCIIDRCYRCLMEQILEDVKEHVLEAKHKVKKLFFDSSLCVVVCLYSATM